MILSITNRDVVPIFLQFDVVLGVQFLIYILWIVVQSFLVFLIFVGLCRVGLSINTWIKWVRHMNPLSSSYFLWLFYWDRRNWVRYSFGMATIISLITAGACLWLWWTIFDAIFGLGMFLFHFLGTLLTGVFLVILLSELIARQHPVIGGELRDRGPIKSRSQQELE